MTRHTTQSGQGFLSQPPFQYCRLWVIGLLSFILSLINTTTLANSLEDQDEVYWEAGLGSTYLDVPQYTGSKERRNFAAVIPYFYLKNDWLTIDRSQTKMHTALTPNLSLAFSFSIQLGVDSDDIDARDGLEDLDPLLELGPSLEYQMLSKKDVTAVLELPIRPTFSVDGFKLDYEGIIFNPKISYDKTLSKTSECKTGLGLTLAARWANQGYLNYFYGVSANEATTARPEISLDASLLESYISGSYGMEFKNWQWGGYMRLSQVHQGTLSNSALVTDETYISGGIYWLYVLKKGHKKKKRPNFELSNINAAE